MDIREKNLKFTKGTDRERETGKQENGERDGRQTLKSTSAQGGKSFEEEKLK